MYVKVYLVNSEMKPFFFSIVLKCFQLDNNDLLMFNFSRMQGLSHPAIEDICDETIHSEIGESKDYVDNLDSEISRIKSLKVKKA